jgi:putative transposase
MMTRKPYPTDLTDEQWQRVQPLLPSPKSGTPKGGRPAADTREVLDAVFYLLRGGQAWRMLPHDFPPWKTVYTRFRLWRLAGVWERVHAVLREEVRIEAGAPPSPQTLRVDSQSVKTTHRGGPRGFDGGKKGQGTQAVHRR